MRWLGLGLLVVLAVMYWDSGRSGEDFLSALNPFGDSATSTPVTQKEANQKKDSPRNIGTPASDTTSEPPASLTTAEIEKEVKEILTKLDELEEGIRNAELHDPVSPYAGMVTLKTGTAKNTDPQKEHVVLSARIGNSTNINITGWRLESYVTESDAVVPKGERHLERYTSRTYDNILLHPGEQAYLITGETPLKVSFRENMCSGHLATYGSFSPSLKKNCPMPPDELLLFGGISDSDDTCSDFVNTIKRCEAPKRSTLTAADISSKCRTFIETVLTYEGCVSRHAKDLGFYTGGSWYIYLDKHRELWRSTGEIIRLLDAEGRVVAVVEY